MEVPAGQQNYIESAVGKIRKEKTSPLVKRGPVDDSTPNLPRENGLDFDESKL